jgi:stage II sporulation SpoAA-like protein
MVERLVDMPPGTMGFRLSGKIGRDEYHELVDPVLEALDRGESVRYLVETAPDFHGLDLGALWEDVKAAGSVGLKNRHAWERFAVVTDKDWMRNAIAAFGWISPGELKVFEPGQLEDAKSWLAGPESA